MLAQYHIRKLNTSTTTDLKNYGIGEIEFSFNVEGFNLDWIYHLFVEFQPSYDLVTSSRLLLMFVEFLVPPPSCHIGSVSPPRPPRTAPQCRRASFEPIGILMWPAICIGGAGGAGFRIYVS